MHTGERNRQNVQGAHALYFNVDTIGIGLMGNYSLITPTAPDDRVAGHVDDVEVRTLGDQSHRQGAVRQLDRTTRPGLANICGHRDTYATACPGDSVESMLPSLRVQVAARVAIGATGYWITSALGEVLAFGNMPNDGGTTGFGLSAPIIGIGAHPSGRGYWLFGQDGGVFAFGDGAFPRFYGRAATQSADGRHGADGERQRLLARRPRRRRVLLR